MPPRGPHNPAKFVATRQRRWSDEQIIAEYELVGDSDAVGLRAGCSGTTVLGILHRHNIPIRRPGRGKPGVRKPLPAGVTDELIAQAYRSGLSGPQVARQFALDDDDVYRSLVRSNVKRRDSRWYRRPLL